MKWKEIASKILVGGTTDVFGAIKIKDSLILAGWELDNIAMSTNLGKTWRNISMSGKSLGKGPVSDIDIYDDHTFAVVRAVGAAFYSSDQGNTWLQLRSGTDPTSLFRQILFDGSPQKVIIVEENGFTDLETIGGASRIFSFPGDITLGLVKHAADGSLRASGFSRSNHAQFYFFSSTDDGITWQEEGRNMNGGDNWSMITDQTDPNRCVIVNEDIVFHTDQKSDLYLTSDNGKTWKNTYTPPPTKSYSIRGSETTGCHDYFISQYDNEVLRSSDKGVTWNSIGGPIGATGVWDTRNIAAYDDSLIFAIGYTMDGYGSIWSTVPAGSGAAIPTLSAITDSLNSIYVDTIGGDARLQIVTSRHSMSNDISFFIHYDPSILTLLGAFDRSSIDHTLSSFPKGTAKIKINSLQDSVVNIIFKFNPVDAGCTTVIIDSIVSSYMGSGCSALSTNDFQVQICPSTICGSSILSQFIRTGKIPDFIICPNPAKDIISIKSSISLKVARIEIFDQLGKQLLLQNESFLSNESKIIDINSLPNGVYYLRIQSDRFVKSHAIVIRR